MSKQELKKIVVIGLFFGTASLCAGLQEYKGVQAYRAGDFKLSQEKLQQALINNPTDAQLLYNNGAAAYRLQEYSKAETFFKKAINATEKSKNQELVKLNQDALYNLGTTYAKQEKLTESLNSFNQLLRKNPQHEGARHNKKIVEQLLQKKEQEQNQEGDSESQKEQKDTAQEQGSKSNKQNGSKDAHQQKGSKEQQQRDGNKEEGDQEQQSSADQADGKQTKQERDKHGNPLEKSRDVKNQEKTQSSQKDSTGQGKQELDGHNNQDIDEQKVDQQGPKAGETDKHKDSQTANKTDKHKKDQDKNSNLAGQKSQQKEPLHAVPTEQEDSQEDQQQPEYQFLKDLDKVEQEVGKDLFKSMTRAHMKGNTHDGQKNW